MSRVLMNVEFDIMIEVLRLRVEARLIRMVLAGGGMAANGGRIGFLGSNKKYNQHTLEV